MNTNEPVNQPEASAEMATPICEGEKFKVLSDLQSGVRWVVDLGIAEDLEQKAFDFRSDASALAGALKGLLAGEDAFNQITETPVSDAKEALRRHTALLEKYK